MASGKSFGRLEWLQDAGRRVHGISTVSRSIAKSPSRTRTVLIDSKSTDLPDNGEYEDMTYRQLQARNACDWVPAPLF